MVSRFLILLILIFNLSVNAHGADIAFTHIVKEGEILSRIARNHFGAPTYSDRGAYAKILKLNPQIVHPDLILPGEIIRLDNNTLTSSPVSEIENKLNANACAREVDHNFIDRTPAALFTLDQDSKFARYSSLAFSLGNDFSRIDATDRSSLATASILSNYNIKSEFKWLQHWSDRFATFFRSSLSKVNYQPDASRIISNDTLTLYGFGLGIEYQLFSSLKIKSSLGADQREFLKAFTATSVTFKTIAIPNFNLGAELDLFELSPFTLGIGANATYLFPSSYSDFQVSAGSIYGGNLYLKQRFSRSTLGADIHYYQQNENTSIVNQSRVDLGFKLFYSFDLLP